MFQGPFHMYSRGILREARDSPGLLLAGEPAAVEESRFDSGSLAYCSSARAEPIETEQEMRRGPQERNSGLVEPAGSGKNPAIGADTVDSRLNLACSLPLFMNK